MITAERLRTILHYDPETGIFTRLVATSNSVKVGDVAGSDHGNGYLTIWIDGKSYYAHRLAWLYMTGVWPVNEVDHINLAGNNNRWDNIRQATSAENKQNQRIKSNNTSSIKGVSWHKQRSKWRACIHIDGLQKHLGLFDTPEAAAAAYTSAAEQHFGQFARII